MTLHDKIYYKLRKHFQNIPYKYFDMTHKQNITKIKKIFNHG